MKNCTYWNRTSWLLILTCSLVAVPVGIRSAVSAADEAPVKADEKPTEKPAGKLDPEKLVGTWQYVSVEKGGEKRDAAALASQKVTITKETVTLSGEAMFVMKYSLDADSTPAKIKLTITESPFGTGVSTEGIIALENDQLKLCYGAPDTKAPEKFAAAADSEARLIVLKRVKSEPVKQ